MIAFIRNKNLQEKKYTIIMLYSEILFQSKWIRGNGQHFERYLRAERQLWYSFSKHYFTIIIVKEQLKTVCNAFKIILFKIRFQKKVYISIRKL